MPASRHLHVRITTPTCQHQSLRHKNPLQEICWIFQAVSQTHPHLASAPLYIYSYFTISTQQPKVSLLPKTTSNELSSENNSNHLCVQFSNIVLPKIRRGPPTSLLRNDLPHSILCTLIFSSQIRTAHKIRGASNARKTKQQPWKILHHPSADFPQPGSLSFKLHFPEIGWLLT